MASRVRAEFQVFFPSCLVTLSRKVNQKRKKSSLHWFKRHRRAPSRASLWRSHKQNCEGTQCQDMTGEHLTERNLTSSYCSHFHLSSSSFIHPAVCCPPLFHAATSFQRATHSSTLWFSHSKHPLNPLCTKVSVGFWAPRGSKKTLF